MGLLSFFKKNPFQSQITNKSENEQYEIPKDLFIEEREPEELTSSNNSNNGMNGIYDIYEYLKKDFESMGYNDAIVNPDESYKLENIEMIKKDIQIFIQSVNLKYEDNLKEIDFHIKTRSKAGLIDIVDELNTRKEIILGHIEKLHQIQKDSENMKGICERVVLSYKKGFNRGLYALSKLNFK